MKSSKLFLLMVFSLFFPSFSFSATDLTTSDSLIKLDSKSKMSYFQQDSWRKVIEFLPLDYQITDADLPVEYSWNYKNHQVHIERYSNPKSPAKIILLHGVGTNGRQLSLIVGNPLFKSGYEVIAIDNLGYGMTQVHGSYNYHDWIQLVNEFISAEQKGDSRPIFLYGLSAGGMLTYHVAAINPHVKGIIGMTFLEQTDPEVAKRTMTFSALSKINIKALKILSKGPSQEIKLPMKWVSKMNLLVNNPSLLKLMLEDPTSAGSSMSLRFLGDYMTYPTVVSPELAKNTHILLTQPEKDRWTPLNLSQPFLKKFDKEHVAIKILPNSGHYPVEKEGLDVLHTEIDQFIRRVLKSANSTQNESVPTIK